MTGLDLDSFGPAQPGVLDHPAFAIETHSVRLQSGMLAVGVEVQPKQAVPTRLKLPAETTLFGAVRKGSFNAVLPDLGRQTFRAGDWFILRTSDMQLVLKEPLSLVLLGVDGPVLKKFLALAAPGECKTLRCFVCPQLREPSLVRHAGGGRIRSMADRIELSGKSGLDHRLQLETHCLTWFRELLRQPQLSHQSLCGASCSEREEGTLREIAAFLALHLDADHTLEGLSRRFHLNQFKLKTGFKTVFGMPVFKYLRNLRIQGAERLLKESDSSVLEIAHAVGYANPSHFARNFKEHVGLLPKAYQRLHRSGRSLSR